MDKLAKDKWKIRMAAQKKVAVDGQGNMYGSTWTQVKQYQLEFQQEYCPSCFYFDPEKNDFQEKGHENDPNDCKRHWTDIAGQCWNYQEREAVKAGLAWVEEEEVRRKSNPVIKLPTDQKRLKQLRLKLVEYEGRLDKYKHPAAQMGTICKLAVLSSLIKDGKVNTQELMAEMTKTYGSSFNKGEFLSACAVIEDYCLTGGAKTHGGTGLKPV